MPGVAMLLMYLVKVPHPLTAAADAESALTNFILWIGPAGSRRPDVFTILVAAA